MNFIRKIKNIIISFFISKRHGFPIGWLAPEKTLEDLREYLHREWGFGGNFKADIDKGEVLNWRKLHGKDEQYHLRVYEDGEIRGYLEYMPEAHPLDYMAGTHQKDEKEKFVEFLGDFLSRRKYVSNLIAIPNEYSPNAEKIEENQISEQS